MACLEKQAQWLEQPSKEKSDVERIRPSLHILRRSGTFMARPTPTQTKLKATVT